MMDVEIHEFVRNYTNIINLSLNIAYYFCSLNLIILFQLSLILNRLLGFFLWGRFVSAQQNLEICTEMQAKHLANFNAS